MAFLSMHEPQENEQWQCLVCGALYAEYVNGCPKCWENGEKRSPVRIVAVAVPAAESGDGK